MIGSLETVQARWLRDRVVTILRFRGHSFSFPRLVEVSLPTPLEVNDSEFGLPPFLLIWSVLYL